jgi:hypothetical protein
MIVLVQRRWCRQVQQRDNHHFKKFSLITTNVVYLGNCTKNETKFTHALQNDLFSELGNIRFKPFKNTNNKK